MITLLVNKEKTLSKKYCETISRFLERRNIAYNRIYQRNYTKDDFKDSRLIITIGGDGTLLKAAGIVAGLEIPIIGINSGNLGFLTELAGTEGLEDYMKKVVDGDYHLDRRAMIKALVYRDSKVIAEGIALNEVFITRRCGSRILRFKVSCNGQELSEYASDGMIVSTPTGSTAYNMSAGGPLVYPDANVHILTAICPHSINIRPVILNDSCEIDIEVYTDNQMLSFDSEGDVYLMPGDTVKIIKASEETVLAKVRNESFLKTLRIKMSNV